MDFAALMNKELSKGKSSSSSSADKKYLKKSEVEENRKAAYAAEQKALEEQRVAKAAAKRKLEEDTLVANEEREEKRARLAAESRRQQGDKDWEEEVARRKRLGLPEIERPVPKGDEDDEEKVDESEDVPDDELREKLRKLGHPAVLFGESHAARVRRHAKLTTVLTDGPIPTTLVLVAEKDMKVPDKVPGPEDKEARKLLFRQLASYFTMVLTEYERAMTEARSKDTTESRAAVAAMVQARDNMKPVR